MKYTFYRNRNGHPRTLPLASDLAARRAAEATTDVLRVETEEGRVVWRRVPEAPPGLIAHKKIPLDYDMVEWFDRAKESR
jgi:hypothetical protein